MNKKYNFKNLLNILFLIILCIGVYMRFHQYAMGRSLWEDETHLALNIMKYNYIGLLKPLDYIQAAPILFLFITKTFCLIFGYSEMALRAFPFISSIITLPLFYYIIKELTQSKVAALIGFLVFSVNIAVIYFSSELKPYGVDLSMYLLMVYLAVTKHEFVLKHRTIMLITAGSIALLSSLTSFIVLFCVACYMAMGWRTNKKIDKKDLVILSAWGGIFLLNYFLFIFNHPSAKAQKENYSFGFCPANIFSHDFVNFMMLRMDEIFYRLLLYIFDVYWFGLVLLLIFIVAIAHIIIRRRFGLFLFTILPVLIHLFLSAFKIYPFWYRLILYLVPCFITLMALGTYLIADFISKKSHRDFGAFFTLACCYLFVEPSIRQYPLWYREIKPALDYINKNYPHTKMFITTPINPYRYYYQRGEAKDSLFIPIAWNISPFDYYSSVENEHSDYLLFHATSPDVDGYKAVMDDLNNKDLIVKEFEYKTYTVSEIRPNSKMDTNFIKIKYNNFYPKHEFDLNTVNVEAIWDKDTIYSECTLPKGNYKISLVSCGTPFKDTFPHINVYMNEVKIGDYTCGKGFDINDFIYEQKQEGKVLLKILMDNDACDLKTHEDRNAFIKCVYINKLHRE